MSRSSKRELGDREGPCPAGHRGMGREGRAPGPARGHQGEQDLSCRAPGAWQQDSNALCVGVRAPRAAAPAHTAPCCCLPHPQELLYRFKLSSHHREIVGFCNPLPTRLGQHHTCASDRDSTSQHRHEQRWEKPEQHQGWSWAAQRASVNIRAVRAELSMCIFYIFRFIFLWGKYI